MAKADNRAEARDLPLKRTKKNSTLVYVLSQSGRALMPTRRCGKVRWMLKNGLAKVVRREPFTIQLLYETTEHTQPVTLGIDPGYEHIGLSASTEEEELFAAETEIRTDVSKRLAERRQLRRTRRTRKVRHRKARFNNRKTSKPKGWLPPSIRQKISSHINELEFVTSILPVSKIVLEKAAFDIQKIINPEISGTDYQNGPLKGWTHVREYVLYRDNHECQVCHGKSGCEHLHTHHLKPKPEGTDRPENQITVCEECHRKIHQGLVKAPKEAPARDYKAETAMNIMRYKLIEGMIR